MLGNKSQVPEQPRVDLVNHALHISFVGVIGAQWILRSWESIFAHGVKVAVQHAVHVEK
jgi:hypothetical protein